MQKEKILTAILTELERDLATAIAAAKTAQEDATNEESKPENEYDTRALEASYVARGQAKRVAELKEALVLFKNLKLRSFTSIDPVSATALVEVESQGKKHMLFVMSKGGGFSVTVEGVRIQVVSPSTPLGEALLHSKQGDIITVELGNSEREYEILSVS